MPFAQTGSTSLAEMGFDDARDFLADWAENAYDCQTLPDEDDLEELGFTFVSGGEFANVYQSECGRFIIKVNHTYDDGYRRFIDLALDRQDNPHYPQIYFAAQEQDFQLVLMETLEALTSSSPLWDLSEELQRQVCFGIAPRNLGGFDAAFTTLVWDMWSLFQQDGITEDLCGENVRVRHNGNTLELVVTDPVCKEAGSGFF